MAVVNFRKLDDGLLGKLIELGGLLQNGLEGFLKLKGKVHFDYNIINFLQSNFIL